MLRRTNSLGTIYDNTGIVLFPCINYSAIWELYNLPKYVYYWYTAARKTTVLSYIKRAMCARVRYMKMKYTALKENLIELSHLSAAQRDILNLEDEIVVGSFDHLRERLRTCVYAHGRRYAQDALIMNATGEKLNARHFIDYIMKKYSEIKNPS